MKKYILRVVLFAFLISACGITSSEPMADREMAEQTVKDFYKAIDKGIMPKHINC